MKKLLTLLFSISLLWSTAGFAEENLSLININNLNRLSNNEIVDAVSNKKLLGYYSKELYGLDVRIEEIHYEDGDYVHYNDYYKDTGKWKVYDNKVCYKLNKSDMREQEKKFSCISVYTGINRGEYYFYLQGHGVFAKITSSMMLIE